MGLIPGLRKIVIDIRVQQQTDTYSVEELHNEHLTFPLPVDYEKIGRAIARRLDAAIETINDFRGEQAIHTSGAIDVPAAAAAEPEPTSIVPDTIELAVEDPT